MEWDNEDYSYLCPLHNFTQLYMLVFWFDEAFKEGQITKSFLRGNCGITRSRINFSLHHNTFIWSDISEAS